MYTKSPCHYTLSTKRSFNKLGKMSFHEKSTLFSWLCWKFSHSLYYTGKFHSYPFHCPQIIFLKQSCVQSKYTDIDTISVPKGFTLQLGKREIEKPMCDHPYCPKLAYISKGIWHGVLTYINQVDTLNIQTLPCQKDYFSLGGGGRGGAVLST